MASKPDFHVPSSSVTVRVRIIDSTSRVGNIPIADFVTPEIAGHTELSGPCFSFLIEHPSSRSLVFDLGVRKDWQNLAPAVTKMFAALEWELTVQKGVRQQLEEHGVNTKAIEGIIWSHSHSDHLGDPSTFEKSTALIVGPGFKKKFTPGYPANPQARILESDYEGREFREITFDQGLKIGRFDAFDYFDDGSFYLLDSPGHATGHICGFARVTSSPPSFILMGGDIAHHGGEFRPSPWHPLPTLISPHPLNPQNPVACPGKVFEHLLRDHDRTQPFYVVSRGGDPETRGADDPDQAEISIAKLQEADALDEVLVVLAHDASLMSVLGFFPEYANEFREKGWAQRARWGFLGDFKAAVAGAGAGDK